MDNVTRALFIAFAVMALAIGLSFGLYLTGNMNNVATKLIQAQDKTRDYESVSYDSNGITNREVGIDTVISTLYKYYKESFSVEIYDKRNNLKQIFDLTTENILASGDTKDPEYIAYNLRFGKTSGVDLFGAPWIVDNKYVKQRIDMYISGKKAYINGAEVDYTMNNLKALNSEVFEEQFIQYSFDGETISDNNGEDIESITGSSRAHTKIIIRYKAK